MAEKHIVVQGAMCKCQFGQAPDKIKVLSHKKEYANDKKRFQKANCNHKRNRWSNVGKKHLWQLPQNGQSTTSLQTDDYRVERFL